jgi:hypothetical protein
LKHRNNKSISKILPVIRQQFETFHLEVLEIIRSSKISLAVVEGPLKNFDFRMVDIFSQNTTVGNDSSVEENDDDDDSVEASKDTSDEEEENHSVSTRSRSTIL